MCWRAGGTAKWSGVRMGGARAGGSKTGFVLRNERDVCGCVLCVLCVRTEMEMVAEIGACGSGCCLTFMLICRNYALLASRAAGAMRGA